MTCHSLLRSAFGVGLRVQVLGFRVWGSGFGVWGLGFGGLGFRYSGVEGIGYESEAYRPRELRGISRTVYRSCSRL